MGYNFEPNCSFLLPIVMAYWLIFLNVFINLTLICKMILDYSVFVIPKEKQLRFWNWIWSCHINDFNGWGDMGQINFEKFGYELEILIMTEVLCVLSCSLIEILKLENMENWLALWLNLEFYHMWGVWFTMFWCFIICECLVRKMVIIYENWIHGYHGFHIYKLWL